MTAQLSNVAIDVSKHPLIKQAYDVCQAIEKCGASPELTDAVTKACALMQGIANAMDSEPVAWVMADDLKDTAIISTPAYPSLDDAKDMTIGEIVPLYAAPPAQLVVLPAPRQFDYYCTKYPEMPIGDGIIRAVEWNNCIAEVKRLNSAPVAVDEIAEQAGIDPDIADAYMQGYHDAESRKPAPLAVPDEFVIPEPATLTNINQLCPLDKGLSQTDFATGWNECRRVAMAKNAVPPIVKGISAQCQGWNACRAAMQADVTFINEGDNHSEHNLDMGKAEPVTGWIKCSESMPEKLIPVMVMYADGEMWSAIWTGTKWDDGTEFPDPHAVTHWQEMPAAPEQEV